MMKDLQPERNDKDDSQYDVHEEEDIVAFGSADMNRARDHQRHRYDSL